MAQAKQLRVPVVERARRYLTALPANVCGRGECRRNTFRAACVLMQGFALSEGEALGPLCEWVSRGGHKFTEQELAGELRSAGQQHGFMGRGGVEPRGCLLRESGLQPGAQMRAERQIPSVKEAREQIKFDAERLRALAGERGKWSRGEWQLWLANRSAVDPANVTADGFLRALYRPERGEKVIVIGDPVPGAKYGRDILWPDEPLPESAADGVKLHANPVDGVARPNPRAKFRDREGRVPMSRGIWECVTAFRYLVLESDVAKPEEWLGFVADAPLRIEAIYTSGGKSLHVMVRVDCASRSAFEQEKQSLAPFLNVCLMAGADKGPLSVLAPTRLPGCWREGKRKEEIVKSLVDGRPEDVKRWKFFPFPKGPQLQKLLYLRPAAGVRALTDLPAVRDVEKDWTQLAALGVSDADEQADETLARLRRGLGYYAAASAACAGALETLNREAAA